METILITGGSGFLGKNLYHYLRDNIPYKSITSVGSKAWDLRNQQACRKLINQVQPTVIIHAAGSVGGIAANQANPGKFMYDNLIMGTNLINEALWNKHCTPKFIMLGTVCSYPKHTPVPFKEEDLWNGYPEETNAPYGIAKKTLMKLAETYHEQYGLNVVNLIPVNMYGPHDHFNLTTSHVIPAIILKFYEAMKNGVEVVEIWGTGEASREFLYVEDCCKAIKLAIENDVGPEPINIGTGTEIKICDLVDLIAAHMRYIGEIIYDKSKPDGQPRRCLDISRAKEKLSFEATTALYNGLSKTIEWFEKENV